MQIRYLQILEKQGFFPKEVQLNLNSLKTGNYLAMPSLEERVNVVKEHLDFSIRWKGDRVGIVEMRRHYANYFKGIPNFKPIRTQLVTLESKDELLEVLNGIVNQFELELI